MAIRKYLKREEYRQYKPLVVPILIFVVVLALSATIGRLLVGRVLETRQELDQARKTNASLTSKLENLQNLSRGELESQLGDAINAIPPSEPTLFALARLRDLAGDLGINISNFRVSAVGGTRGENFKSVEIRLDLQGNISSMFTLLDRIRNSAPLMRVSEVKIFASANTTVANISISSAWSPLPTRLGKIEDPVQTLTVREEEVLVELRALERTIGFEGAYAPPQGRTNPFGF